MSYPHPSCPLGDHERARIDGLDDPFCGVRRNRVSRYVFRRWCRLRLGRRLGEPDQRCRCEHADQKRCCDLLTHDYCLLSRETGISCPCRVDSQMLTNRYWFSFWLNVSDGVSPAGSWPAAVLVTTNVPALVPFSPRISKIDGSVCFALHCGTCPAGIVCPCTTNGNGTLTSTAAALGRAGCQHHEPRCKQHYFLCDRHTDLLSRSVALVIYRYLTKWR